VLPTSLLVSSPSSWDSWFEVAIVRKSQLVIELWLTLENPALYVVELVNSISAQIGRVGP
jgi:hypothetical protein